MASVWIGKQAFLSIVVSSIEVYKKEAFGLLLGRKHKENYLIKYAINLQSVRRNYDYIIIDKNRIRRINESLSSIMKQNFVGDFHSHADGPAKPSKTDIREMKKEPGMVYILVIVKKKKGEKWKHETDRSLSGPVGKYFVHMKAYEVKEGKVEKVKIRCPYIRNINKIVDHKNSDNSSR